MHTELNPRRGIRAANQRDWHRREGHSRLLRENDVRRIAFKKRISQSPQWRIAVLDLETWNEVVLNETHNVDDQVEWLDDAHVLYSLSKVREGGGLATDVWVASVDGSQRPRVFLSNALSPAVVRVPSK
jgi:hypothetical protein